MALSDPQTALTQLSDLFRLMLMNIEGEAPSSQSAGHKRALGKITQLMEEAVKKADKRTPPLSEVIQVERILDNELKSYPVAGLREKILPNIGMLKAAWK